MTKQSWSTKSERFGTFHKNCDFPLLEFYSIMFTIAIFFWLEVHGSF